MTSPRRFALVAALALWLGPLTEASVRAQPNLSQHRVGPLAEVKFPRGVDEPAPDQERALGAGLVAERAPAPDTGA